MLESRKAGTSNRSFMSNHRSTAVIYTGIIAWLLFLVLGWHKGTHVENARRLELDVKTTMSMQVLLVQKIG